MPRMPAPGNSTISPDITFCRPNTRAIPSPTDSTWPVSATLVSVSNEAICFFRISEISAGRISIAISSGSLHGVLQALQPGFQTGVVESGPDPDDEAPEQIRLLPVTDEVRPYAAEVVAQLKAAGVRATVDASGDRLGKLIRTGEQMKIPVLAVIGAKEAESGELSLRSRRDGDLGSVDVADVLAAASRANQDRAAGLGLQPAAPAA